MATNSILNVLCWATQYVLCEFMKGLKPDPTKIFKFQLFRGYLHGFSYATGPQIVGAYCQVRKIVPSHGPAMDPMAPVTGALHFQKGGTEEALATYISSIPTAHGHPEFGLCQLPTLQATLVQFQSFAYFKFHFFVYSFSLGGSKFVLASNLCVMVARIFSIIMLR